MNPHSTQNGFERRESTTSNGPTTFKFPEFSQESLHFQDEHAISDRERSPSPGPLPVLTTLHSNDRWQARRGSGQNGSAWVNGGIKSGPRHGRQKSLSEAIRTVRTRKASVSQNAHEIAEALKAPVSPKLVVCIQRHATLQWMANWPGRSFVESGTLLRFFPTRRPRPSSQRCRSQ